MKASALIYSENEFGKLDGKVANGLARHSEKYEILGVIDSTKVGLDTGEYLDNKKSGIPIFSSIMDAINILKLVPEYFIYGIAPLASYLNEDQKKIIFDAMQKGMNIVNGLPEFFNDNEEYRLKATEYGVKMYDIRKSPPRKDLHIFTGKINAVKTPVIMIAGTDCAVGKRTTAVTLVTALRDQGVKATFIATGQTGILQGSKFGVAIDVLSSGFATGEVENAILEAIQEDNPDIIIVEGQGALSHPAFTSSSAILRGAMPKAIIVQHPPKRLNHCDYPNIPMPTLESEIELIEVFSKSHVIAITINHEDMVDEELETTIDKYEYEYELPTTDVLIHGCDKLIRELYKVFPKLGQATKIC